MSQEQPPDPQHSEPQHPASQQGQQRPQGQSQGQPQGSYRPQAPYGGYGYGPPAQHGMGPSGAGPTGAGPSGAGPSGMVPPMGMMPPPWAYPPRSSGTGWKVATVLLLFIAVGSVLLNLVLFVAVAAVSGPEVDGVIVETVQAGSTGTVAIVPLSGVILNETYEQFDKFMDRAERDDVAAVVVEIDSPGGAVTPSDLIYRRIERYKADTGKPVVISMGSLAASGGYYAAVAGDQIYAQPTTITGSIGVILPLYNLTALGQKIGIEDNSIISSGANFKDAGSLLKPLGEEERDYLQGLIDEQFDLFKQVVVTGRAGKLKQPIDQLANGQVYIAKDAVQYGLVDALGSLDDACADAAMRAGLGEPTIVRYKTQPGLLEVLGGASAGAQGKLTAEGPAINIDKAMVWELTTPRPMYLWRGQ